MAIEFIGSGFGNGGASDTTYNFSSLLNALGAVPTLQPGDLVVVCSGRRHTASLPQTAPTGYSTLITHTYSNGTTQDTNLIGFYKVMGSTPDSSFILPASGVAAGGSAFTVHVFRGVDVAAGLDGPGKVTATNVGATATDAPSITPVTPGAGIFVVGAACAAAASLTILTKPANLSSIPNSYVAALPSSGQATIGAGFFPWVSGAFDPAAFGGGCAAAAGSWAAVSIAMKPAAVGGNMKVWNGSAWVEKPAKVWNGSAWVAKPVKVWNGSAWVLS